MRILLVLAIASSCTFCQELPVNYNIRSITVGICPATQGVVESIRQDIRSLINTSVLPALITRNQTQTENIRPGYGTCGCGGPGWRRAAYLNMSDPTQTCPPAWELITTPRRSCARPSNATTLSCYSAVFPTQRIQYSHVCGRIIGYQIGDTEAFRVYDNHPSSTIDDTYVDGVSLTYGNPRHHIWTFANALQELLGRFDSSKCPCTSINNQVSSSTPPPFIENDYFCETGVPPNQTHTHSTFYTDDPLWDGQDCGPTSTCECTFNNPPWFCKQLPQSTNADLEVRLCSYGHTTYENTPIELVEIYTK